MGQLTVLPVSFDRGTGREVVGVSAAKSAAGIIAITLQARNFSNYTLTQADGIQADMALEHLLPNG